MSIDSKIAWTNSTWNPVVGCSKCSDGCDHCYAIRDAWRLGHNPNPKVRASYDGLVRKLNWRLNWTGEVRCLPDRLAQPLHWKRHRRIFVNSQSDLFHEAVPFEFIDQVFAVMALCPEHDFQVLTKRPDRMLRYAKRLNELSPIERSLQIIGSQYRGHPAEKMVMSSIKTENVGAFPWPLRNVWAGVSVESQSTTDERIPLLLQTPAAVRFISYEPALGPVDFSRWMHPFKISRDVEGHDLGSASGGSDIDWVIAGSESGPHARDYDTEWFASVARQCEQAGVAFFMKQLTVRGRKLPFEEFPGYLQVREYPSADRQ